MPTLVKSVSQGEIETSEIILKASTETIDVVI